MKYPEIQQAPAIQHKGYQYPTESELNKRPAIPLELPFAPPPATASGVYQQHDFIENLPNDIEYPHNEPFDSHSHLKLNNQQQQQQQQLNQQAQQYQQMQAQQNYPIGQPINSYPNMMPLVVVNTYNNQPSQNPPYNQNNNNNMGNYYNQLPQQMQYKSNLSSNANGCPHMKTESIESMTNLSYIMLFDLMLELACVIMFLTLILPCYLYSFSEQYAAIPKKVVSVCTTCKEIVDEKQKNSANRPIYLEMFFKILGVLIFVIIRFKTGHYFFIVYYHFVVFMVESIASILSYFVNLSTGE